MRRPLAALITVAIAALMLWMGLRRENQSVQVSSEAANPDEQSAPSARSDSGSHAGQLAGAAERIEELLECARRGDVQGYLNSFGGPVRARLEQQVRERSWEAFAAELRRAGQLRKGHAVFAAEPARVAPESARVTVEATFADRIERQIYHLESRGAGWLVTGVESVRNQVPMNPVGSWATYQEPEGVPVPTASMAEVDNQEKR